MMEAQIIAAFVMMALLAIVTYFINRSTERTRKLVDAQLDECIKDLDDAAKLIETQGKLLERYHNLLESILQGQEEPKARKDSAT